MATKISNTSAGWVAASTNPAAQTPMMRQYLEAKLQHPDAIVMFRMGDFYETFFEDAEQASRLLGLTLTSRNKADAAPIPMAGVPHHAMAKYIPQLLDAGCKVAICEQMENPSEAKGIVRREVVRVITPGVVIDDAALKSRDHNYLAALALGAGAVGIAWVDVSTGELHGARAPHLARALDELGRVDPAEVLVGPNETALKNAVHARLDRVMVSISPEPDGPAAETDPMAAAEERLRGYLRHTQKGAPLLVKPLSEVRLGATMTLGPEAVRNLELVRSLAEGRRRGSLLGLLDRTRTAMGGRLMKRWVLYPLMQADAINARQAVVGALVLDAMTRSALREALDAVHDLERLVTKIVASTAIARDLVALSNSLARVPEVVRLLTESGDSALAMQAKRLDFVAEAAARVHATIVEAPPATMKDGGVIREGVDADLDTLIGVAREGKSWFVDYAARMGEVSGISNVKIRFNNVFGYFLEVTKANISKVPEDWLRKQTLANSERYYTAELKEREEIVLGADDRRLILESRIFEALRSELATFGPRIQATAAVLAELDVMASLAETAHGSGWSAPTVDGSGVLDIEEGRHPVIEALVPPGEFVPNDLYTDVSDARMLIITGPNMAGKSTVMRQAALIVILAQMGSFVPAKRAHIGVADQVFTRVGASDNLARGESTFMVEMKETAAILAGATAQSLIIVDEIGRGTSTWDGVSIAWAVAEYLHDTVGARTLFATHYHELTALSDSREGVVNWSIAVKEWNDDIVFLRRMIPGGTNRSYGIQVGRLAGLPESVVSRARTLLANLEARAAGSSRPEATDAAAPVMRTSQLSLFGPPPGPSALALKMAAVDPDALSPREALALLYTLKELATAEAP